MAKGIIHLSQYLGVAHSDLTNRGVYDALIGTDSRLHIDPLLVKGTYLDEFNNGYSLFLDWFVGTSRLVRHVKYRNDRFYNMISKRMTFKEVPNTGLGFSKTGGHGTGISGSLSKQLTESIIEIVNAGIEDPEIFAIMPVIEENIGPDRISDMLISILRVNFIKYTDRITKSLGISKHTYNFKYDFGTFTLPYYNRKPILFVPQAFLCSLPEALTWNEIEDVSDYNKRIRERVCAAIGIALKDVYKVKKHDIKNAILSNPQIRAEVLGYYKSLKGIPYDFERDNLGEYIRAKVAGITYPKDLIDSDSEQDINIRNIVSKICDLFKSLVENNRMYTLFHDSKSGKYSETNAQLLFFCIAQSYCNANNIDLTRESDAGAGELDFKFSRGTKEKVIIEIKLSSNNQLQKGLECQLPAYMMAENGKYGILMILLTSQAHQRTVENVKKQHSKAKSEYNDILDVLVIDATLKPSASKLK